MKLTVTLKELRDIRHAYRHFDDALTTTFLEEELDDTREIDLSPAQWRVIRESIQASDDLGATARKQLLALLDTIALEIHVEEALLA